MSEEHRLSLGAIYLGNGQCKFRVWAPLADKVEVCLVAPRKRIAPLEKDAKGFHQALLDGIKPGTLFVYRLDEKRERPDPASRAQPRGVHGPSAVVDPAFAWQDRQWRSVPLEEYIIYELHVGTFTPEGTFDAIIPHLDTLNDLGITAVELMPVAQFPGERNWGYDGVYPFAVQNSYGGAGGLKRLVNACHQRELAVVLDVVYNHLGPEGNYLGDFGPYFTDRYRTPWGLALNFDGPWSDEVRRYFIENALYWIMECHIDALRLDALHAIVDLSAQPFLQELADAVHGEAERIGRRIYLIAESDLNDTKLVRSRELGGYGLDAQWNDDFHHALHTLLTGEQSGYYQDFGTLRHLVTALTDGYVYSGQYSHYRGRRHGNSSKSIPARKFIVCSQNHDQVGNRIFGERLSQLVDFDALKLAAAVILLSPYIPLLFMGEEYGEPAPFPYFVSHSDPTLIEAVRRGRREEFAEFAWQGEPPDPQDEATFLRAKLDHKLRCDGHNRVLHEFYRELIRLRKTFPALASLNKEQMEVTGYESQKVAFVRRWSGDDEVFTVFQFADTQVSTTLPVPEGRWRKQLDSSDERWQGGGTSLPDQLKSTGEVTLHLQRKAFALFHRTEEA
ncbi:MAG TPA: malto-oligosyltrehalose trehalohydrolase [Candidatus Methylomirabilis sp.]|nr:malto-oligosyltrehalose trehalohydrolase [Candidatus Methylomirabilis sp.]